MIRNIVCGNRAGRVAGMSYTEVTSIDLGREYFPGQHDKKD